jgi:hypothetical protein
VSPDLQVTRREKSKVERGYVNICIWEGVNATVCLYIHKISLEGFLNEELK